MLVTICLIYAADRGPVFVAAQAVEREGTLRPGIFSIPDIRRQIACRMRRMGQRAFIAGECAFLNRPYFAPNGDHRRAEPFKLGQWLTFGRLDHQRARHRKGHGGCVEAIIHQPFGDIIDSDAGFVLQRAQVDDTFVSYQTVLASVEYREMVFKAAGQIVG